MTTRHKQFVYVTRFTTMLSLTYITSRSFCSLMMTDGRKFAVY